MPSTIKTQMNLVLFLFLGRSGHQDIAKTFCDLGQNRLNHTKLISCVREHKDSFYSTWDIKI